MAIWERLSLDVVGQSAYSIWTNDMKIFKKGLFGPGFVGTLLLTVGMALLIGCGGSGGGGSTVGGGVAGGVAGGVGGGNTVSGATTAGATTSGGVLSANVLYYGVGTGSLNKVNPDGTGVSVVTTAPASVTSFATDPKVAGQFIFSFPNAGSGFYGIYTNSSFSLAGAVEVVPPTYDAVYSLQVSPDGNTLYFVASVTGDTTKLRKVAKAGGTPITLDDAQTASLNFAGDTLVYEKFVTTSANIFKRSTADVAAPVQLTNIGTRNDFRPQWNKQGNRVIFCSQDAVNLSDVFSVNSVGGDRRQLTNTVDLDEIAASYNDDSTRFATVVSALDLTQSGLYVASTSGTDIGRVFILPVPNSNEALYWTSNLGRSPGGASFSWSKSNPIPASWKAKLAK